MRYIDRRFLFPVAAATVWAQQPSPAAAEADAALRARVQQFFQLQVDTKFRAAEAMVADDTKDLYYNGKKFNIKTFSIEKTELTDNNTRAKVTLKAKVTRAVPGFGLVDFDAPSTTLWKIENGQWVYYIDQGAALETPFGSLREGQQGAGGAPPLSKVGQAPDLATLRSMVKIDRSAIELTPASPRQTVTVSNDLPGGVDIELVSDHPRNFTAEIEKKHLEAGEKTLIRFTATADGAEKKVVQLQVSQLGTQLDIQVTKK